MQFLYEKESDSLSNIYRASFKDVFYDLSTKIIKYNQNII